MLLCNELFEAIPDPLNLEKSAYLPIQLFLICTSIITAALLIHPDKIGNSMVVVHFSNASHGLIAFTTNSSLPSEEIHDSCWSRGTRPWGSPTSSSVLLFGFPKSSLGLPVFITSAHTVINQGACLLPLWPGNTQPWCLCQISCQHIP